tara:strand:+ start:304 stop:660 length:357 start_codon:yes stop_codon:yes gene_type:complete
MFFTQHKTLTDDAETTVLTIPNGFLLHINYIFVANHGGSTNSIDLWWENSAGVDQMYFFDGTSINAGNKEILGGQSETPIFVLHQGEVVKAKAASSGDIEVAFTFNLVNQPSFLNNYN